MLGLNIEETRIYQDLERQTKLKIVPRLLSEGLRVEKVAEILDLPIESVMNAVSDRAEQS
ncbi:aspartate aminotransferase [Scytonema sp. NUACC26]|uniref:aspartate aminotransferase n=1 Tax=Scytonema sp. NUACC26 TaxID=3140176 RepID=UPI0034DCC300